MSLKGKNKVRKCDDRFTDGVKKDGYNKNNARRWNEKLRRIDIVDLNNDEFNDFDEFDD